MIANNSILSRLDDPSLIKEGFLYGGTWRQSDSGLMFAVLNPATGTQLASVPNVGRAEAERAIGAAHEALRAWRELTGKQRAQYLRAWFNLLEQNAEDLAWLISAEGGKPLGEARAEVRYGLSFVEWFAEEAKRVDGDVLQSPDPHKRILVLKQSVGVCVSITPWNFPLAMITRKVAPALAAGCTIVVKPAEQTPLTALAIAELGMRSGLPAGVFNVVTSNAENAPVVGTVFSTDERVAHLSFTGSTEVGRLLMRQCASSIKKIALELGGHAPFIVFDDADIEAAVDGAMSAKYRNAGQACISPNRFYVQSKVYDQFVARVAQRSSVLRVGSDKADPADVDIGPLIDAAGVAKVTRHVDDAVARGALVMAGGSLSGGNFFTPTVLSGVTPDMLMSSEETFGPVIGVSRFDTEEEAITLANHKEYGLAAYLYTNDLARAWRFSERLEFGMVGVNTTAISNEVAPFGGIKQSGLGREGSKYGIDEYLELKYLCLSVAS